MGDLQNYTMVYFNQYFFPKNPPVTEEPNLPFTSVVGTSVRLKGIWPLSHWHISILENGLPHVTAVLMMLML